MGWLFALGLLRTELHQVLTPTSLWPQGERPVSEIPVPDLNVYWHHYIHASIPLAPTPIPSALAGSSACFLGLEYFISV